MLHSSVAALAVAPAPVIIGGRFPTQLTARAIASDLGLLSLAALVVVGLLLGLRLVNLLVLVVLISGCGPP